MLEPRTALAYERSELVADETAARVAALASWRSGRARILVASVQALLQHTIAPADLPDRAARAPGRRAGRPGRAPARAARASATRRSSRSPAVASSRAAAGSSTCSRRRRSCRSASTSSATRSTRCARSTRPTSGRSDAVERAVLLPASASSSCRPAAATRCGDRLGARAEAAPRAARRRPRPARAAPTTPDGDGSGPAQAAVADPRAADVGDAAEVWAPLLAPATGLDHLAGGTLLVLDEPGDVGEAAEFLWRQADERRADLVAAGELPKDWPATLLAPRDWKRRLLAARTLELTWESEAGGAIAGGGKSSGDLFGWREPQLPAGPRSAPARRGGRALGRRDGAADRHRLGPGAAPRRAARGGRPAGRGVTDAIASRRRRAPSRSSIEASTAASWAAPTASSSSPIASCSATSASAGRRRCAASCRATSSSG